MSKKLITLDSMREYNQKEVAEIKAEVAEVKESIVQPDYEQNDPAAADYIKNRPFYSIEEEQNVEEVLADSNSDYNNDGGNYIHADINGEDYSVEDSFNLTINGETYYNIPFRMEREGQYAYGNLGIASPDFENTGENYFLVIDPSNNYIEFMWQNGIVESFSIAKVVKEVVETVKKLDDKFIPDSVALKTYVTEKIVETENYVVEKISEVEIPEIPYYAQLNKIYFNKNYSDNSNIPHSKSGSFNEDEIYFNHADNGTFHFNKSISLDSESLIFQNYSGPTLGMDFVKKTTFNNGSIIYSNKESAEAEEIITTLTFPAVSGVIATQEYVDAYVPKMLPEVTQAENTKVLQVVNGAWNVVAPTVIYVGEAIPTSEIGEDGDLYLQID